MSQSRRTLQNLIMPTTPNIFRNLSIHPNNVFMIDALNTAWYMCLFVKHVSNYLLLLWLLMYRPPSDFNCHSYGVQITYLFMSRHCLSQINWLIENVKHNWTVNCSVQFTPWYLQWIAKRWHVFLNSVMYVYLRKILSIRT